MQCRGDEKGSQPFWLKPFLVQGGNFLCVVRQVECFFFFREFSSARRCDMPRRGWQTVEVGGSTERKGSARQQPNRGAGRQPRRNASHRQHHRWQREAHSRRCASGRACTPGEVGDRHQRRGRVRPDFSSTPRGSEASTEASSGPTCGAWRML